MYGISWIRKILELPNRSITHIKDTVDSHQIGMEPRMYRTLRRFEKMIEQTERKIVHENSRKNSLRIYYMFAQTLKAQYEN